MNTLIKTTLILLSDGTYREIQEWEDPVKGKHYRFLEPNENKSFLHLSQAFWYYELEGLEVEDHIDIPES